MGNTISVARSSEFKGGVVSLRSVLLALIVGITVAAVTVSASLVFLTTALHRTTTIASTSAESVRLAQDSEIDLLLYARAQDNLVRRDFEKKLQGRLSEARRFVTTAAESRVFDEARMRVDEYFSASTHGDLPAGETLSAQNAAFGALEALSSINVEQAREAHDEAVKWDNLANAFGSWMGAILVLAVVGFLVWLARTAFKPLFALDEAMEHFGKGVRSARAPEKGLAELRQMSRRFNEMANAISAQRQSQIAFLGGIAHDLRTPLSVLHFAVGTVGADKPLPSEPRLRQLFTMINRQMLRFNRMLDDFLDMARIDSGTLEMRIAKCDARAIVQDIAGLFEANPLGHLIDVSLPEEAVLLKCDRLRIEQVLTNLISNAIKYSPPGSLVTVALESREGEIALRVADRGLGISDKDQRDLFEPFRRVGTPESSVPGIGLGLFVVRRIIEAHGGRIDIESSIGEGSTFSCYFPLVRANGVDISKSTHFCD